jgi:hypothetical protein
MTVMGIEGEMQLRLFVGDDWSEAHVRHEASVHREAPVRREALGVEGGERPSRWVVAAAW